jgi:hypothetical protein
MVLSPGKTLWQHHASHLMHGHSMERWSSRIYTSSTTQIYHVCSMDWIASSIQERKWVLWEELVRGVLAHLAEVYELTLECSGAGKSTIAQALFRMVNITEGSILVDGIDLQEVELDTLRWKLSAIPQDSLLFAGKMRDNLDPMGLFTDVQMNDALRRCGLIATPGMSEHEVKRLEKFKLDSDVALKGKNFSYVWVDSLGQTTWLC